MHQHRLWRANGRKGALERKAGGSWWIRSHPAPLKHSGSTRQSQASRQREMLIPMVIHNTSAVTSPALPNTYSSDELEQSQHRDTVESPSVEIHKTKLNVVLNNLL